MGEQSLRLLIVDDHEVVRRGLAQLFSDHSDLEVVGQAGTVEEALVLTVELHPDVILLDLQLSDGNGLDLIHKLPPGGKRPRIAVLTSHSDDDTVFKAIGCGVDGYLLKDIEGEELVASVKEVALGRSILAPVVTNKVIARIKGEDSQKRHLGIEELSVQEKRVLAEVATGKTNRDVAMALGLKEKTVKNYLSNVLAKLGVARRTEAAIMYLEYQRKESVLHP